MNKAKGELKRYSNGTATSPFPKSWTADNKKSKMQGNQDEDNAVVKRPAFTPSGQK